MVQSQAVWVCGEALIDLVTDSESTTALVGGGPANSAKALANLGLETYFIGGISQDSHGVEIERELLNYGVNLSLANRSVLATAIANAKVNSKGVAEYEFTLAGSATFDFHNGWLPSGSPSALYIGSLATVIEPGSDVLLAWARNLNTEIVFDPNVRPSVISHPAIYLEKLLPWFEISKVVKLSIDDLNFIFSDEISGSGLASQVNTLLGIGPELVVVTRGEEGISGYSNHGAIHVEAEKVKVVDTVGAGDTVGAIVTEGLVRYGAEDLAKVKLEGVLRKASRAAGITCSRAGAKPPRSEELEG